MMKKHLRIPAKLLCTALSAFVLAGSVSTPFAGIIGNDYRIEASAESDVYVNFAEALQLSLYYYDANRCGAGITGGWLEWRGDCHTEDEFTPLQPLDPETNYGTNLSQEWIDEYGSYLDPDGDGYVDLMGGWHDAGDHVKFGLPGSYAASTVGWGYYEFRDAYVETGNQEHVEDILRWINDYYLKVTYLDENGDMIAYCYQVGEGNIDHNYWNAPELQNTSLLDFARPAYFATDEAPGIDQTAGAAASLAVNYLNFKDSDPEYAQKCLDYAVAMYEFCRKYYDNSGDSGGPLGYDGGFYTSSYCYDELAWCAVWLYECTGDYDYIEHIISVDTDTVMENGSHPYDGYLCRIIEDTGNCWQNIWVHCWDTIWGGVFAKLAPITNTARDWYIFRWNLEYWSGLEHLDVGDVTVLWDQPYVYEEKFDTSSTTYLAKTPAGFSMLNNYGSCRYNCSAQLCALVYAKYCPESEEDNMRFADWALTQMIYIMGDNPMGYSYIVGYSDKYASHPHHRASHGSITLNMDDPVDQTHVLWGALVGGPDQEDYHNDVTSDYIYNEVAVDYNAAFVGACAGFYNYYGKNEEIVDSSVPRENFPPAENADGSIIEYSVASKLEQENLERTQVSIQFTANTKLPPRYTDNITVRYWFDISELVAAGQTIDDCRVDVYYDQNEASYDSPASVSDFVQWGTGNLYYVEIDWGDSLIFGTREIQIGLIVSQDANYNSNWDPANDYSREGIIETYTDNEQICMYVDDELVWGVEPEYSEASSGGDVERAAVITAYSKCSALDGEMADICACIKLENTGNDSVNLDDVTIRYWFTDDYNASLDYCFDYAHLGEDNFVGTFGKTDESYETADSYFEISLNSGLGVLGANGTSGDIQFRIIDNAYSAFSQVNDYSYNASEEYIENEHITVYVDGVLVYGIEPDGDSADGTVSGGTDAERLYGDLNGDGVVNSIDATISVRHALGVLTLDEDVVKYADVNGDGVANSIDSTIITRHALGVIPSLPI